MSEIRVDAIKTRAGAVPTANDLGLNITGNILQVKSVSFGTQQVSTSSSYVALTNATLAITPSSTSSKILVIFSPSVRVYENNAADANLVVALSADGGSNYLFEQRIRLYDYGGNGTLIDIPISKTFLHGPATTSEITYTGYFKKLAGDQIEINPSTDDRTTLTLIEVAG